MEVGKAQAAGMAPVARPATVARPPTVVGAARAAPSAAVGGVALAAAKAARLRWVVVMALEETGWGQVAHPSIPAAPVLAAGSRPAPRGMVARQSPTRDVEAAVQAAGARAAPPTVDPQAAVMPRFRLATLVRIAFRRSSATATPAAARPRVVNAKTRTRIRERTVARRRSTAWRQRGIAATAAASRIASTLLVIARAWHVSLPSRQRAAAPAAEEQKRPFDSIALEMSLATTPTSWCR